MKDRKFFFLVLWSQIKRDLSWLGIGSSLETLEQFYHLLVMMILDAGGI